MKTVGASAAHPVFSIRLVGIPPRFLQASINGQ
ncbi:hypothetical protein ACVW0Y_004639 [Pseudomonas sp. TE3786]